VLVTDIKS